MLALAIILTPVFNEPQRQPRFWYPNIVPTVPDVLQSGHYIAPYCTGFIMGQPFLMYTHSVTMHTHIHTPPPPPLFTRHVNWAETIKCDDTGQGLTCFDVMQLIWALRCIHHTRMPQHCRTHTVQLRHSVVLQLAGLYTLHEPVSVASVSCFDRTRHTCRQQF